MMGKGQKEKDKGEKKMGHMGGMMGKGMSGGQDDKSADQPKQEEHQH